MPLRSLLCMLPAFQALAGARLTDDGADVAAPAEPTIAHAAQAAAPAEVDAERQTLAKRYARQRQVLSLVDLALSALVILVLLFSGLSFGLRDALSGLGAWQPAPGWRPILIGVYFLALYAVIFALDLPLTYYSGYVLPHRYRLSTQRLGAWLVDQAKGLALSIPFGVLAVEFVYALLALTPDAWWLWAAAGMLLFTVVLSNLAPVLLLPLFYKLTPLPEGEVTRRSLALARQAGVRVGGIYAMNMSAKTTAANAMVMGLGNTRRIILGDTLLDRYTPDEIEVVVAHELGHQAHHDIPKGIVVQTALTLVGLYLVNLALHAIVGAGVGYQGLADAATMPLVGAALGVFGLVTMPLSNGYSRRIERQADAYALDTTRRPDAFISAMTRLANQNLGELDPAPIVEFLLYNHPAIGRRIAFAQAYAETSMRDA